MRNATILGTTTLLLALCALPCAAQRGYGDYPPGSYVETCRNIHIEGDRLEAECRERDGDWRRTSLDDFDRCTSEIVNNDGGLVCAKGDYGDRDRRRYGGDDDGDRGYYRGGWQGGYPSGDYVQTCRNIYIEGNRLTAECQKRNGGWRRTSLDNVDLCTDQIVNNNGRLVCPQGGDGGYGYDHRLRAGWQGDIPSGTYTETCRNISVDGGRLIADCQKRNGDWRHTSLDDFQRCTSAPANENGRLVCGR
jgi:CVNH domain